MPPLTGSTFTGFDSAWGGRNAGAVCHLREVQGGGLELDESSWRAGVRWSSALESVLPPGRTGSHLVAIDQPLVVPNETGSRPVDVTIARALMSKYALGAHAANRTNACFGEGAGIWTLLDALKARSYEHAADAETLRRPGKYFFECYPNLALVGWLDRLPRYKIRHRDREEWKRVLDFLRSRSPSASAELPIVNAAACIPHDLAPTKANEDRVDALIAAYVAAWHRRFGSARSLVVGDMETGYVVTPVNETTRVLLTDAWERRGATASRRALTDPAPGTRTPGTSARRSRSPSRPARSR